MQRSSFPPSAIESVESLRSIADAAPDMCFVAEINRKMSGYLLAHPWLPDDLPPLNQPLTACPDGAKCLFIHDLAIVPSARKSGHASTMVHRVLAAAGERKMTTASLLSVQKTAEFWARFGFVNRPELTHRFRERVFGFYEIDFQFMTALIDQAGTAAPRTGY